MWVVMFWRLCMLYVGWLVSYVILICGVCFLYWMMCWCCRWCVVVLSFIVFFWIIVFQWVVWVLVQCLSYWRFVCVCVFLVCIQLVCCMLFLKYWWCQIECFLCFWFCGVCVLKMYVCFCCLMKFGLCCVVVILGWQWSWSWSLCCLLRV